MVMMMIMGDEKEVERRLVKKSVNIVIDTSSQKR
jgi:hypothetical protein